MQELENKKQLMYKGEAQSGIKDGQGESQGSTQSKGDTAC